MNALTDTNILLRSRDAASREHRLCLSAIDQLRTAGHELCICAQVIIEYWAVATRPVTVNGLGQSPADVSKDIDVLKRTFTLLPEPPDMAEHWLAIVTRYDVIGKQAHDARLAALMLAHGVTYLLTLNGADFARYEGIVCVHPSDLSDILHPKP